MSSVSDPKQCYLKLRPCNDSGRNAFTNAPFSVRALLPPSSKPNPRQSASTASMRPPCDEAVILSGAVETPCVAEAKTWILGATILASSMAFIDSTVVNVALPAIQASFHATVVGVQWVVESYGLFLGALILVGGSLGDLLGRRLIFVTGVATFAVASVACGLATNIHQLIVARSIQGLGAALLVPGSLAIISTSFDEKSRGQAIGTWSGFTAITTAVGPVLGGWLVEHASWRWAFFINVPLAAAVIAISVWRIPESRSASTTRVDWAEHFLCQPRFERLGLRLHRIYKPGLGASSGLWEFDHRLRMRNRVCIRRSPRHFADGPTHTLRVPQLHWRKPAHVVSIFSDWDFLLLVPSEPDTSSGDTPQQQPALPCSH